MRLSNLGARLLITIVFACFLQGCGSSQPVENKPVATPVEGPKRFPFSVREPDIFQADLVITAMDVEMRHFVARKGDKRRLDTYRDDKLATTELRTDAFYDIDHAARTFSVLAFGSGEPPIPNDVAADFFRGGLPYRYDELERKDGIVRYKTRDGGVIASIDEASGLMIRQEFYDGEGPPTLVYELRNLKLEVDDSVFQLPAGYRQIKK